MEPCMMNETLCTLRYNGEIIYQGNFKDKPTCPPSIIRRYWPEISDDFLRDLATKPAIDEGNDRRLEWNHWKK